MKKTDERGTVLILVLVLGMALMTFTVISLDMVRSHVEADEVQHEAFMARQIAESGASQALVRINQGGILAADSGTGANPEWVDFSGGQFLYYTDYDLVSATSTIRAWGRVQAGPSPSTSSVAPDDVGWDGTDWLVKGVEISVRSKPYIPEAPMYFGNGGVEKPMGGFAWTNTSDPADPSTWGQVTSNPSSYQHSSVPFQASALDHPVDYLYNAGMPGAAETPHPFKLFVTQNPIGQYNVEAWFANSAGTGSDPTTGLAPPPTNLYYDMNDKMSPDYVYPVDTNIPDVQTFSWALWNKFKDSQDATRLNSGGHAGVYGDLDNPGVTFVTGTLRVDAGQNFKGAGVLVIRDDYDPNFDTNNTPNTKAFLDIRGDFKWTGLVVIAGWAPTITVASGGDATIVGTVMGEDSVQSGGETSLDSATIIFKINDDFRVLYSNDLFTDGGLIPQLMPEVSREVVGIREL